MTASPDPKPDTKAERDLRRADFPHFLTIPTRWMDNDVYGHVNNVTYYGFFDTAVNRFLIDKAGLDPEAGAVIGLVVETGCRYRKPVSFPDPVTVGVRVGRIGNSSVRYEIGIFRGDDDDAAAEGHFIHVYVGRESRRPVPLPPEMRAALETLLVTS